MRRRRRPRGRGALGGADGRAGPGLRASLTALPSLPAPFLTKTPAQVRIPALRGRRGAPGPPRRGTRLRRAGGCSLLPLPDFSFFLLFPPSSPPSSFRLLPTLEFSIYSSEAQGKCAMFVDFSLYVDHDRNLRALIFSLLGRGFAWLISLSILAKFVVVVVPRVIWRGSEGQGAGA